MHIRSITEDELDRFSNAGGVSDDYLRQTLPGLWASGQSHPEWCFVIEENHEWVGRVALCTLGDSITFRWLTLPWEADYLEVGTKLFQTALKGPTAQGFIQLRRFVSSDSEHVEKWHILLKQIGMRVQRQKIAFRWQTADALPSPSRRLLFRSLNEVGKEAYIEATCRVTEQTLDRVDQEEQVRQGVEVYAREEFQILQESYFSKPDWWQLAYTPENKLVGLLMPILFDQGGEEGTIGYIGVVPEQRGKGYIDDLLVQCTTILRAGGARSIFADTDSENFPMINSFRRVGYQPAGSGTEYLAELEEMDIVQSG